MGTLTSRKQLEVKLISLPPALEHLLSPAPTRQPWYQQGHQGGWQGGGTHLQPKLGVKS